MEEKTHVILSVRAYEEMLNFLATQPYQAVVQLISGVVNDKAANEQSLVIVNKDSLPGPGKKETELTIVKGENE